MAAPLSAPAVIAPERTARVEIRKAAADEDAPTASRLHSVTLLRPAVKPSPLPLAPRLKIARERNVLAKTVPVTTALVGIVRAAKRLRLLGIGGRERTLLSPLRLAKIGLMDVEIEATGQREKIALLGKNGP